MTSSMSVTEAGRVAIVGAGPAGLMAAEMLATAGHTVTVFERMPSPGRKLLIAGRGGLNLTHSEPLDRFLTRYGNRRAELEPLLAAFSPADLRAWADALGADTFVGSSGRVFPRAMKASPLLRAWLGRLDRLGVTLRLRHHWLGWNAGGALQFRSPAGDIAVSTDATVLALGGGSWTKLGSDGAWVPVLRASGIQVDDLKPANAGLTVDWSPHMRERFAGTPLKRIAVSLGDATARGEAMVTRDGLEGGAIYAIFASARSALAGGDPIRLDIDLRPDLSWEDLSARLSVPRGKQSIASYLKRRLQLPPVAVGLLREATETGHTLPTEPKALARLIKRVPIVATGTAGLERAISSAGGVPFTVLTGDLMLLNRPGTFVCGEMIDWEAPTGGYLLQGCLSSGVVAARGADAWLKRPDRSVPAQVVPIVVSPTPEKS